MRSRTCLAAVWLRRLYTTPDRTTLVAMDTTRRRFGGLLRQLLIVCDEVCRMVYCGAPIQHGDHTIRVADDGPTSEPNGQGLCEACNSTKDTHGWNNTPGPGGTGHTVTITTPTGHTYTSRPPPPPGAPLHQRRQRQRREIDATPRLC